jgi:hypothetical protein
MLISTGTGIATFVLKIDTSLVLVLAIFLKFWYQPTTTDIRLNTDFGLVYGSWYIDWY